MPFFTKNYNLSAFFSGDIFSASMDMRRFVITDNEMGAISDLIGDGVISGWLIEDATFPDIRITKGSGIIDRFYINTDNDSTFTLDANGTYYIFAKRVIGTIGEVGNSSELLSVTASDAVAPAVPSSLAVISSPNNVNLPSASMIILLSWNDNTEVDFDHYNIYRSTDGATYVLLTTSTSSEYTDSDIVEDMLYYYRVSAEDESGNESGFATGSVSTPISSVLPPNPRDFKLVPSDGGINLLWFYPESILLSQIVSYRISYSVLDTDDSVLSTTEYSVATSQNNSRIDNLENDAKYGIRIQVLDNKGRLSDGVYLTTIPKRDLGPPDPKNISVVQSGYTDGPKSVRLVFSWYPGGGEYESTSNVNYRIYLTIDGKNSSSESLPIETSVDQLTLDMSAVPYKTGNISIPENTFVTARITCISPDRHESQGNFLRFRTNTYSSAQPLRNASATYDIRTIRVSWWNNDDTEQVRVVIERKPVGGVISLVSDEVLGRIWTYIISKPALGYTYYISLTPINKDGISGETSVITQATLTTSELALPPKPVNVYVSASYKSIYVSWQVPESTIVEYYNIYRSKTRHSINYSDYSLIDTVDKDVTSFTDYGLEDDEDYTYYITSVDIFSRESKHLVNNYSNVGMIAAQTPDYHGELSPVLNPSAVANGFNVDLEWDIFIGEPFSSFQVLRSIDNLHSFETITSVDYVTGQTTYTYSDVGVLTQDGVTYYYIIQKVSNNATFFITSINTAPDNSIYIGKVETGSSSFSDIDNTGRRDILNMKDSLSDLMATSLNGHAHRSTYSFAETINGVKYVKSTINADLVDLNPELVVTSWTTTDGINFYTEEDITGGTSYVLKVNGLFPSVFYEISDTDSRITFAEAILSYDTNTNTFIGQANLELSVLGIEETTGILSNFRFSEINAQQIGYGRLVSSQIPKLNHEGRINEELVPDRETLSRYDNYTFYLDRDSTSEDPSSLFGTGTTFFAITNETSEVYDIQNFDNQTPGDTTLFQSPAYSSDTSLNVKAGSGAEVSSDYSFSGTHSYKVNFEFTDEDPGRWVQLSTAGFNPVIDLNKKFSIKLMVQSGSFYFGLGIRKSHVTNTTIGSDGGIIFSNGNEATINFVGVTKLKVSSIDYPDVPTPEGKFLVQANSGVWQTFEFDILNESILPFTGEGTLTTENGFATLEHLNFSICDTSSNPDEEVVVYIDDVVQLTDSMAASTNDGIKKSSDYGSTWSLVRYIETPISKFYKANVNGYLWGISSKKVYFSTDVNNWFDIPGTNGVQTIRDITEDSEGNMYVSTDRGVYLLEMNTFSTFAEFTQTSQTNPFSSECYAMWRVGSEVFVSTELGVYKTPDYGETWDDTSIAPTGVVFYGVTDTISNPAFYGSGIYGYSVYGSTSILSAYSKRKVYRKLSSESQFLEIADLNEQISTIDEIWKLEYYNGNIYASTNDGVYQNTQQNMFESGVPTTEFDRVFSSTDINNSPNIFYSLDVIGAELFLGGENILYSSDIYNKVSTKYQVFNKEIPTIVVDDEIKATGFTYSSFNGVVNFRESIGASSVIKVDKLPRKVFYTKNGGWSQSNLLSPVLIKLNGEPKWVDFSLDDSTVTSFATSASSSVQLLTDSVTPQNSYISTDTINRTISSANLVLSGNVQYDSQGNVLTTATRIDKKTVSELLKNYYYTISSINTNLISISFPSPSFVFSGILRSERTDTAVDSYESISINDLGYNSTLSSVLTYNDFKNAFEGGYLESELLGAMSYGGYTRTSPEGVAVYAVLDILNSSKTTTNVKIGDVVEENEGFTASDADGIIIDSVSGKVSFTGYDDSTDPVKRNKYRFYKQDRLLVCIYGSPIGDTGTIPHHKIEDSLDLVNSGMPFELANAAQGNLVKAGIFFERQYPYSFGAYFAQNIKSKYYPANVFGWYDVINSTIDYDEIVATEETSSSRIPFDTYWFNDDAYFANMLWICTDTNILEYQVESDGSIIFSRAISPSGSDAEVRSIAVRNGDEIYVVSDNKIFTSHNFGVSWLEVDTENLPEELYKLVIVNDNLLIGTNDGIWWSGSGNDEFTRSTLSFSSLLSSNSKVNAEKGFVSTIQNLESNNFAFLESGLSFYISNSGINFVALGELSLNDVSVVNKLYHYKNIMWVATDKGLYSDAGTMFSESVSFSLQSINGSAYDSLVKINDITGSKSELDTANEAMYIATSDGYVYRYMTDTWKSYQTSLPSIHKIHLVEEFDNKYVVAIGYNKIEVVPVVIFSDSTEVETVDVVPCEN